MTEVIHQKQRRSRPVFVIVDFHSHEIHAVARSEAKAKKFIVDLRLNKLLKSEYPLILLRDKVSLFNDEVIVKQAVVERCRRLRRMGFKEVDPNNLMSFKLDPNLPRQKLKKIADVFADLDVLMYCKVEMIS